MKLALRSILVSLFVLFSSTSLIAQSTDAATKAAELRAQLADVEARQLALQARAEELDVALKPENIANSLAGVGSLHPEDLREERRKQLQIERDGVSRQLELLAQSHALLESSIQTADNLAYQQSAEAQGGVRFDQMLAAPFSVIPRRILALALLFAAAVGVGVIIVILRLRKVRPGV